MNRKALALAVAALLVVILGGTSRAQVTAGGTYRITVDGNPIIGWSPDSGATDQTSSDKVEATGTLVGLPVHGTDGTADYHIASGPGIVRAKIDGSFTIPSGLAYSFDPTMQAVSTTELTISGPDTFYVNTSVNLHVDGIIEAPVCGGRDECGAESVYISIGPFIRQAEFNTFGGTRDNSLGLTLDAVPGGYRVHGDVTSSTLGVLTNTAYPVTIVLNLSGGYSGSPTPTTLGGDFDDPAARYQVSFAPTGPVLNDIPAGYTVSGPSVVDNHWTDPFAPSGPADATPPVVTGVPDRAPNFFGWYSAPVTIDWQATDDSGQATDPADTVAATDGKDVAYTSGQSCDGSGNCATGSLALSIDTVAPSVTCPSPAPVFELNRPSGTIEPMVVETLSGIVSGSVGVPDVSSVGPKSITFRFDDKAGNTTTATCEYDVVDTTPPVVTGVPDRQPNQFGWYGAPVTIDWQATDNSGVASDPADTVVSTDGKDVDHTSGQSCDAAGNCATGKVTLSVDQVAPVVTCPQPAPVFELNASSYGAIEPTVVEPLSGIVSGSLGLPDVSSVGQKSITFRFDDKAGNTTTVSCDYVVVDRDVVPPVVTVPADMTVDATGPVGAQVTYAASASDNRSLAPSLVCTPASATVFPIGTTTVTCTATDGAGNSASASFKVQVRTPTEQITRLVDKTVADLDLPALRPVFRLPLQTAAAALAAKNRPVACAALNVYIGLVRLAPPQAFTPAEKTDLIADANRIRAVVGC